MKFIDRCREQILYELKRTQDSPIEDLENIHKHLDKELINSLRMKSFESINKLDWKTNICKLFEQVILETCGPDYMIQKKLNLSIVMPGDKSSTLPGHSDCWSGDSPFQVNFWIPLTRVFKTNGMFILPEDKSLDIFSKIKDESEFDQNTVPEMKYFIKVDTNRKIVMFK